MAEIKKISVGGVTYDIKDEKARTIAENPMLPVTGILDAQGGTDVISKATSHRGIFYYGNGVFKAKSISNDTDFHSTWDAYNYNNVHYPASDVYASRGGAFSNALYLMEGSLYRIQAGAMVQVVQGSAGEGGELGEDVSIVKSGSSYVFGNGAVVGQNAQLNGTIATGANVGEGAKVGKSTFIGEAAKIHGGVMIGTSKTGHGGVYINSEKEVSTIQEGDTFIGKNVTIEDNATISVEMQTDDFDGTPLDEQGNYLLGNNTIIGWDSNLGAGIGIETDGESFIFHETAQPDGKNDVYIGRRTEIEPGAKVGLNSNIGRTVNIGDQVEIGKQVYIEEGFSVDEGAITTTSGILNLTGKGLQSTIGGSVSIGDLTKIGEGIIIGNGVTIDKNVIIGKDISSNNSNKNVIVIGVNEPNFETVLELGTGTIQLGTGALRSGDVIIGGEGGNVTIGTGFLAGKNVQIDNDVKIGAGVGIGNDAQIGRISILQNPNNGDIKINPIGMPESVEITLGRCIRIGTNTFIDTGIDRGLYIKCHSQDIQFGTDVGLQKPFFCVDDSSLSIGTSKLGKIKFVTEEAPELTIGSGYLSWGTGAFIKAGAGSITVHNTRYADAVESTLSWGTGVLSVPGITFEKNALEHLNYDKVTFGFESLSLGTGMLKWSDKKIESNEGVGDSFGVDFSDSGYVRLYNGSKYVRIPLNNQTIGAVSDETISV